MAEITEVAVVGAGLMGAATARALARRGVAVTLFEAREPGHRAGSSHGSARIFRWAYPDPLYVGLAGQARELWRELEADEPLIRPTGGVNHGRARDPEGLAAVMRAAGLAVELLTAREAGARWPGMVFDGPVLFHPEAGVLDPDRAIAAMVREAVAGGCRWYPSTPVLRVTPSSSGVSLTVPDRSVTASVVVVAVGAWLPSLLDGVVDLPRLTVSEQRVFHFPRRDPASVWPAFIHAEPDRVMYGLPGGRDGGPGDAVKVGAHFHGPVTTADTRTGEVDEESRRLVSGYVRDCLPGLEPVPLNETTCLYTSTDNEDFLLDRVGPVVVCSPCSGHGAKFAPLIGELAADLCLGGDDRVPDRFRLSRAAVG
jgi:glycine/D-amino acid oxidase-like deaminating enzyme